MQSAQLWWVFDGAMYKMITLWNRWDRDLHWSNNIYVYTVDDARAKSLLAGNVGTLRMQDAAADMAVLTAVWTHAKNVSQNEGCVVGTAWAHESLLRVWGCVNCWVRASLVWFFFWLMVWEEMFVTCVWCMRLMNANVPFYMPWVNSHTFFFELVKVIYIP